MHKLTKRQEEVLEALSQYIKKYNYPPAYRDLGAILGIKSSSTISGLLNQLKSKGYISWIPTQPRTLRILKTAS
jgi:repressor LexA